MRRLLAILLCFAFLLPLLVTPVAAQEARLFPETGKRVQGEFLAFYDAHGGPDAFGLPITDEMTEYGRTVQYFTRARLEAWPENPAPYRVQLGLLGVQMGKIQPAIAAEVAPGDPVRRFFPETGHVVAFGFKDYWESRGGLEMFGYPTTEQLVEGGAIVQYFQRVRMEWRPENAAGNQILLGDLGLEYVKAAGWPVPAIAAPATGGPTAGGAGRILFHLSPGGDIYSVRPDGSDLRRVGQGMDPTPSPDGSQLAFARWYSPGVTVADASGAYLYSLQMNSYPWQTQKPQATSWSPDGRFIAFHEAYRDWRWVWGIVGGRRMQVQVLMDLWRIDVVDLRTGQTHIVVEDDYGVQPAWTNDGRLVFTGAQGLYVVANLEGQREITKVPNTTPLYQAPAWSPTGEWVAFQWKQHDHQEIGIMRPDGSGFRLLTSTPLFSTPANNVTPAWSPDGSQIAFVSDRNGQWELFVMNADGSNQHKVDLGGLTLSYENVHERILGWSK